MNQPINEVRKTEEETHQQKDQYVRRPDVESIGGPRDEKKFRIIGMKCARG